MSRAYRISVKTSDTRTLKAADEIGTTLEILEILPPEAMAGLLRDALAERGFEDLADGTMLRRDGDVTITVDPCSGDVTVKAETSSEIQAEAHSHATGFDDMGPTQEMIQRQARDNLRSDLEKKFDAAQQKLQQQATQDLERHLQDVQPEISQIVNKVTRDALKIKAAQMGDIKEMSENEETGELTIKLEV